MGLQAWWIWTTPNVRCRKNTLVWTTRCACIRLLLVFNSLSGVLVKQEREALRIFLQALHRKVQWFRCGPKDPAQHESSFANVAKTWVKSDTICHEWMKHCSEAPDIHTPWGIEISEHASSDCICEQHLLWAWRCTIWSHEATSEPW